MPLNAVWFTKNDYLQNLELKNLGQVNLILGDNDCGKTTALNFLDFIYEVYQVPLFIQGVPLSKHYKSEKYNQILLKEYSPSFADDVIQYYTTIQQGKRMSKGWERIILILHYILDNEDGMISIDDIEYGIHYNKYEPLCEMILLASHYCNTQVFITTHSREFAKTFLKTAAKFKKPDSDTTFNEDVKTYRFYKKDKMVVAADYGNATASIEEIDLNDGYFTRDV